jgi:hypothetical protein
MCDSVAVTCPFCEQDFYVFSEIFDSIRDVESAAEQLLERYRGGHPSAGDVQKLKERITQVLVSEFGIGEGRIQCD